MQAAYPGVYTELTEDYDPTIADNAETYNDRTEHHLQPYLTDFLPMNGGIG